MLPVVGTMYATVTDIVSVLLKYKKQINIKSNVKTRSTYRERQF